MNSLFNNLLISCPNGGGLYFSYKGEVYKLDAFSTTGLCVKEGKVLRGIQPEKIYFYDNGLHEISQDTVRFDDVHDVYLDEHFIYLVGTSGNEIIKLNQVGEEVRRWTFTGEKDSYHINCLEKWNGRIIFSAFGEFGEHRGYKGKTEKSGFVQELHTGQRLITGLSQPHSLVSIGQNILLANSEYMELIEFDPQGNLVRKQPLDGYTRGICVSENIIYVGLSCSRNIDSHGAVTAVIVALDRDTWAEVGRLHIPSAEIYAIQEIAKRDDVIHVLAKLSSAISCKLADSLAERDGRIASLSQSAIERDNQIASLSQSAIERDNQIASLSQSAIERDNQIASLSQAVIERDNQIASMSQSVIERDNQIASQSQAIIERDNQIASQSQAIIERDNQIASQSQAIIERDNQIASLTDEAVRRREWALGLDAELRQVHSQFDVVLNSNSWRMTSLLRETRRRISTQKHQIKHYTNASFNLAKRAYQALPISYRTKAAHRSFLASHFPKMLLASGSHPASIPVLPLIRSQENRAGAPSAEQVMAGAAVTFTLPISVHPMVSVILPIYGKLDYTLRCLSSITANPPVVPFEVIVVDDCSPDHSFDALSTVAGIRLIRNQENQGFIRTCNTGAHIARGQYLCFLNNDTEVTRGWLDELLRTFSEFPGTGMVGSKLVYPDGRLQEAGGIIWEDGSGWNFGRFHDPLLPVYNYAREVDYCSGASIMVPKALFDDLGGFDEHYLPAYYEDVDLAFKIRRRNHRVIYQPLSTVIHYEGVTSGTEISRGIKAYQTVNMKKFHERWKSRLQGHHQAGTDVDGAKDRRATRCALVMDHCTPTPNQDAGSVIIFNMLLLLREMDFQVTFIPEDNFLYMPEYTTALQRAGVEVLYAPYVTNVEQHLKKYGMRYELALLIRPAVVERNIAAIRAFCPDAKVLFHTVDLHFLRMSREAALLNDKVKQKAADEMKQRELAAMCACDASIVVSTAELELLRSELPEIKPHVFPLIMEVRGTNKTFAERKDIIFVGGYQHMPNVDAVQYFVSKIMPLLRSRLPGVRFFAAGSNPPAEIQALASQDVIITGFIEEIEPMLDQMRVSVAPLRFGAGIKGKIGSAMALGLPVVATPLATEGMSLSTGENILVADGAEEFADAVVELYQNESLWNKISQNGLTFADKAWSAEAAWKKLHVILEDLGISTLRNAYPLTLYGHERQKNTSKNVDEFSPIASVKNRVEFQTLLRSDVLKQIDRTEKMLVESSGAEVFTVEGYCIPCQQTASFIVDMQSGGKRQGNSWLPNWRERLVCPSCQMNNRQRLVAALLQKELEGTGKKSVYLMEQVTPIYAWAMTTFKNHDIIGSEYLGHQYAGGSTVKGIRHEDVESLSFPTGTLDVIVSNDVFEHIPTPAKALMECARVLKNGGVMLATIPFHSESDESVVRAKVENGQLVHIYPPAYHGNPVSSEGSLVFTDFGWDLMREFQKAGFTANIEVYSSIRMGHLGGPQLVFRLEKSSVDNPTLLAEGVTNILGEVLWHAATSDATIEQVSHEHKQSIIEVANSHLQLTGSETIHFLEVAAYAHITGYLLADQLGWNVTLSDISVDTLALGASHAHAAGLDPDQIRRVASDFHDLPFPDDAFDIVYIASALHHTLSWQKVLRELQRVTAPGGLLILQNEPCKRYFCFYKFPANRADAYRPMEAELFRQGLMNTVAEPYPGSRPETLFGMIENQQIPLSELMEILKDEGEISHLHIDSAICMSDFENKILATAGSVEQSKLVVEAELKSRVKKVMQYTTDVDVAMGYRLPTPAEISEMAEKVAHRLNAMPDRGTSKYPIALADLFGGAVTAVMRKTASTKRVADRGLLRYDSGIRKDVIIGYPPGITEILDKMQDLVPDIQAGKDEIMRCFPENEWWLNDSADLRFLVLSQYVGHIRLQNFPRECGRYLALLRIYGAPADVPFRIRLLANEHEIAGIDVYQADSFLLRGEVDANESLNLEIRVGGINQEELKTVPGVTIAALRVVCLAGTGAIQ